MENKNRSPIESFQNYNISQHISRPLAISQLRTVGPQKVDQAIVMESYRKMRLDQQQKLAQLNMSKQMKKKLFGLDVHQQMRVRHQNLVIFNHPFKGKIIMTKQKAQEAIRQQKMKQSQKNMNDGNQTQSEKYHKQSVLNQNFYLNKQNNQRYQQSSNNKNSINLEDSDKNIKLPLKNNQREKTKHNGKIPQHQEIESMFKRTESFVQNNKTTNQLINNKRQNIKQQAKTRTNNKPNYPIIGEQPTIFRDLGLQTTQQNKINLFQQLKTQKNPQFKTSIQKTINNNQNQQKFFKKKTSISQAQQKGEQKLQKGKQAITKDKKKGINTSKKILQNEKKLSQSQQNIKGAINSISMISSIESKRNQQSDSQKSLNRNLFN